MSFAFKKQEEYQPTPASAFIEGLCHQIGQQPNEDGQYNIGAKVVLTKQWADVVYITTIRTPDKFRGKGLSSFAVDELVSLADIHGVTLKTDCSGVNDPKKGLSTEQLRGLFERRGFRITHNYGGTLGYEMVREPIARFPR